MQPPGVLRSLPLLPEWYVLVGLLALISAAGLEWPPLLWALPGLILGVGSLVSQAVTAALRAPLPWRRRAGLRRLRERATIALLHLLQPVMRLRGRLSYGLHPLRRRTEDGAGRITLPWPRKRAEWHESWRSAEELLDERERRLDELGARVRRGGPFDRWDLEIRGGLFGSVRMLEAVEEHGQGKQLVWVRSWPTLVSVALPMLAGLLALAGLAVVFDSPVAAAILTGAVVLLGSSAFFDCAAASRVAVAAQRTLVSSPDPHEPRRSDDEHEDVAP
jgi:hypothetical protein